MKLRLQVFVISVSAVRGWFFLSLIAGALVVGGCTHTEREERGYATKAIMATEAPPLLSGACAVLLTNGEGFSAQVLLEEDYGKEKGHGLTGQLLVRGSKLFFAPEYQGGETKLMRAAGLRYIWDVDENQGLILSEALQGYAPLVARSQVTNIMMISAKASIASEKVDGYSCEREQVSVQSNTGTSTTFTVWRAAELNRLPVRIAAESGTQKFTAHFSKIRRLVPAAGVFQPPEGFTKYNAAESLTNELIARQQNLRRKVYEPTSEELENFQGSHRQH
jgi:hypothetical protein